MKNILRVSSFALLLSLAACGPSKEEALESCLQEFQETQASIDACITQKVADGSEQSDAYVECSSHVDPKKLDTIYCFDGLMQ